MTIDRLSSLLTQLSALRAELSRRSGEARRGRDTAPVDDAGVDADRVTHDSKALRKQLADIVRGLSIDDSEGMNHACRRVVKAVLMWEFGQGLREHSEWQSMIDTVVDSLVSNDRFRSEFNKLVEELQV